MEIDEDIEAFLVESYETLEQLESDLLKLEKHPPNPELIQRIYRSLHTLKGNAGYLNLDILPSVAHGGENLLTSLENGQIILTPQILQRNLLRPLHPCLSWMPKACSLNSLNFFQRLT